MFKVGDKVRRNANALDRGQWYQMANPTGVFTIKTTGLGGGDRIDFEEDGTFRWNEQLFHLVVELEYI